MGEFDNRIASLSAEKRVILFKRLEEEASKRSLERPTASENEARFGQTVEVSNRCDVGCTEKIERSELRSRELRIVLQKHINVYLFHALPLCVILADDRLYPWYYERFIQLCAFKCYDGGLGIDFIDWEEVYKEVLSEVRLSRYMLLKENSIVNFLKDSIDRGYYAIIYLDEYYLLGKRDYHKSHFVHESLVYGFDDVTRKIKAIGLDEDGLFSRLAFDYDHLNASFKEAVRLTDPNALSDYRRLIFDRYLIALIKTKERQFDSYPFDLSRFSTVINEYTFSLVDKSKIYLRFGVDWPRNNDLQGSCIIEAPLHVGFEVYNDVLLHIDSVLTNGAHLDYRIFHLLSEHKRGINDRLNFVVANYIVHEKLGTLIKKYEQLMQQFEVARLRALRCAYAPKEPALLEDLLHAITRAKDDEGILMIQLAEELATCKSNLGF